MLAPVEWPPRRILTRSSLEPFFTDLNQKLAIDGHTIEWCRNPRECPSCGDSHTHARQLPVPEVEVGAGLGLRA